MISTASITKILSTQPILDQAMGIVTLSPSFPRPKLNNKSGNLYIHALTREAVLTKQPQWQRIDRQLIAMHADLKRRLSALGINTDDKLLRHGFQLPLIL